jgi:hypothetical protein
MEDPSRILGKDRGVAGAQKRGRFSGRWSVLLIDDVGRTISFYLSKRLGFAIMASLAVLVVLFICSALSFVLMLRTHTGLQKQCDLLTAELESAKSDKEKAMMQLVLLKETSNPTDNEPVPAPVREPHDMERPEQESLPGHEADRGPEMSKEPEPAAVAPQPLPPPEEKIPAPDSDKRVAVDKLEIWRKPGGNDFRFRYVVKNANREGGKISGYTFLVLTPHESSPAVPPRVFPGTSLVGGKPSDYRRGLYFSIARYKSVDGTLTDISTIGRYRTATIYAYSDTGNLLMERAFDISDVLRT